MLVHPDRSDNSSSRIQPGEQRILSELNYSRPMADRITVTATITAITPIRMLFRFL